MDDERYDKGGDWLWGAVMIGPILLLAIYITFWGLPPGYAPTHSGIELDDGQWNSSELVFTITEFRGLGEGSEFDDMRFSLQISNGSWILIGPSGTSASVDNHTVTVTYVDAGQIGVVEVGDRVRITLDSEAARSLIYEATFRIESLGRLLELVTIPRPATP